MRALGIAFLLILAACVRTRAESGVANTWRAASTPTFERGKTTEAEVAQALGPPSQLVNLEDRLVFYYLTEQERTHGVILLVYNTTTQRVVYDRAIFFFDKEGILRDYALSHEQVEYKPPEKPNPEKTEEPAK